MSLMIYIACLGAFGGQLTVWVPAPEVGDTAMVVVFERKCLIARQGASRYAAAVGAAQRPTAWTAAMYARRYQSVYGEHGARAASTGAVQRDGYKACFFLVSRHALNQKAARYPKPAGCSAAFSANLDWNPRRDAPRVRYFLVEISVC